MKYCYNFWLISNARGESKVLLYFSNSDSFCRGCEGYKTHWRVRCQGLLPKFSSMAWSTSFNCTVFRPDFGWSSKILQPKQNFLNHLLTLPWSTISSPFTSPVGWGCRIHRLDLCRWVILLHKCPWYDTKQSDAEATVMLPLWGMQTTPPLPLFPGPLWPGEVAPDRVLSTGQIELFDV